MPQLRSKIQPKKKKERQRRGKTNIDIELTDEAGEVVVLEIVGEECEGELGHVPYDEAVAAFGPRDDGVGGGVLHHVVALVQERCH